MNIFLQLYKDKRNLEKGFNAYWNKGFDEAIEFFEERGESVPNVVTVYEDLALINGLVEVGHNKWIDKEGNYFILTKLGFKLITIK